MRSLTRFLILVTCTVLALCSTATAIVIPEDIDYSTIPGTFISEIPSNKYDGSRPIIIFFPGSGEANSIYATVNYLKDQDIYDNVNCDLMAVAINNFMPDAYYNDWDTMAKSLVKHLESMQELNHCRYDIKVDCFSLGGLGASLFMDYALEAGLNITELTYADACTELGYEQDNIKDYLKQGIKVNIYASTGPNEISERTQNSIEELTGKTNFRGYVFDCRHNETLHEAIYKQNLHKDISYH